MNTTSIINRIKERCGVVVHPDTIYKARRNTASKKLAVLLEKITGINRLKFLYPDEFGDPWEEVDKMK